LVTRHRKQPSLSEFIQTLVEYERVHIVTVGENYAAMRAKGDYALAEIQLVPWSEFTSAATAGSVDAKCSVAEFRMLQLSPPTPGPNPPSGRSKGPLRSL
jgi:hypothetical protein